MRPNTVIVIGLAIAAAGVLARLGLLGWFGNLPGDVRIESDRTSVFIPITSMILVSIGLSFAVAIFTRFFGE